MSRVRAITAVLALLAVAVWLGGLLALGAIAAPVVFSVVPAPSSADAMTIVFRRFDLVAMACAAFLLSVEATRALVREPFSVSDHLRVGASALAGALAVLEGAFVSPRIAALHWSGAVRGLGAAGTDLARLHDVAEACGKAQLALLVAVVALQVVALRETARPAGGGGVSS
jgi:putative copper export protein